MSTETPRAGEQSDNLYFDFDYDDDDDYDDDLTSASHASKQLLKRSVANTVMCI